MRIARFTTGDEPAFGVVAEKDGQQVIMGLVGDPLYTEIRPSGKILPLEDVRLLAPVIPRSKVVCVGDNYAPAGEEKPAEPGAPLFFLKPNTAVIGPQDPIQLPAYSQDVRAEVELAVVIKRLAKNLAPEQVSDYVLGYTVAGDLTACDAQAGESQWVRAKAFDTSCPLGPWIETDFAPAEDNAMRCLVDDQLAQQGSTANALRSVENLISEISAVMTLLPGDVVLTGTPAPAAPLREGQRAALSIAGIGTLENPVVRR
ncbi:fumarylacetoacetate hydrolase family protein [Dermabacteraceae bacterium P13115]|nr:fumarylacetoacetate hydrolase family protein [Dermabacteraceae bacterium TAE3-ERU27]